ncbi:splicing factor 3B subunit 2-like, partial [Oncorhynchus keta]
MNPPPPGINTGGMNPPPPGMSMMHTQRQRVPPPPGEDAREVWQGEEVGIGPKIPQALEKILQLKEIRQEQLSTAPTEEEEEEESQEMEMNNSSAPVLSETEEDDSSLSKKD